MADIDAFASDLLEEAKRFLERAKEAKEEESVAAFLHAALLVAFSSLEAHLNSISGDFLSRQDLSVHERGILLEKEVRLQAGKFVLGPLRMYRMEDRIEFLHVKFSGLPLDKQSVWWGRLIGAIGLRNKLVHVKEAQSIIVKDVELAVSAIIETIDALYRAIYKRPLPAANMRLQSRMTF